MYFDTSWYRYKGTGEPPEGQEPYSRDEKGRYLADPDLVNAVNTALTVEQPLLVVGESGTGKTTLAWSIASELGIRPVLEFHTRSDHRARDVLFVIDNLRRFYDAQAGHEAAKDLSNYIEFQALGKAITSETQCVVLIDEIDKAPRDFPNDLLDEIDKMQFALPDLRNEPFTAKHRPIVVITSNNERQLPDPFLRRCVFHYIEFPKEERLREIIGERLGHLKLDEKLVEVATKRFLDFREQSLRLEKPPATGELLPWMKMLVRAGVNVDRLAASPLREIPFIGALLKNKSDLDTIRKSAAA